MKEESYDDIAKRMGMAKHYIDKIYDLRRALNYLKEAKDLNRDPFFVCKVVIQGTQISIESHNRDLVYNLLLEELNFSKKALDKIEIN